MLLQYLGVIHTVWKTQIDKFVETHMRMLGLIYMHLCLRYVIVLRI
jgi:hypothetical protein